MSAEEQFCCALSTCSVVPANITRSRDRNCPKTRPQSPDLLAWPSSRNASPDLCFWQVKLWASWYENTKYKVPAVYDKNLICSIIAGNINPGHLTASSHTSSAESNFLQGCLPSVSLFQCYCPSPVSLHFSALSLHATMKTLPFIIKKEDFPPAPAQLLV